VHFPSHRITAKINSKINGQKIFENALKEKTLKIFFKMKLKFVRKRHHLTKAFLTADPKRVYLHRMPKAQ
jgi:hypothetical protein